MKTTVKYTTLSCALCFLFIAGLIWGDKAAAQTNREAASGHGTIMVTNQSNGNSTKRQFSFSARRNSDGTVSGTAVLHNPEFTGTNGKKYRANFEISCLKVVGNIAIMGGSVKSTNDPNLTTAAFFAVQDNGEPGKDKDMISDVLFSTGVNTPADCAKADVSEFALKPIEAGNIQVRNGSN